MLIIHRYSLDIKDVESSNFSIYGAAARIDWRILNQESLIYIRGLALRNNDSERLERIDKIAEEYKIQ